MDIPDAKASPENILGLVTILAGSASVMKVDRELKNLIDDEWDFKVKQLASGDYLASFPDVISVDMFSKFNSVDLALYGLKVRIAKTKMEATASAILQSTWIKVFGIPSFAREEEIVKELTSLAAEPLKVDVASLGAEGPVRVKVNCRDPTKIRGFVEVFFNGIGYELRFVSEGFHGKNQDGGPGDPPRDRKGGQDKDKKKEEGGEDSRENPSNAGRRERFPEKEQGNSQGDSQEEEMEELIKDGSPRDGEGEQFDRETPTIQPGLDTQSQETNSSESKATEKFINLEAEDNEQDDEVMGGESQISMITTQEDPTEPDQTCMGEADTKSAIPDGKIRVHSAEGTYLMDTDKWPNLNVTNIEPTTSEETGGMEDGTLQISAETFGKEERDQTWLTSGNKRKERKKKPPAMATRTSARISKIDGPIIDKATKRMQEKDDILGGKRNHNPFIVLNNVSNTYIENVIRDFGIEVEDIDTQIETFRIEERARAALAEANYKSYLEQRSAREAHQGEVEASELGMNKIDNSCRGTELTDPQAASNPEGGGNSSREETQ